MTRGKRFSVIIPTRDRKRLLEGALESAALQDYPRDMFEVIVVNDGSTDGTREFIDTYAAGHKGFDLTAVNIEAHRGVAHARNAGVTKSQGEIVAFMDDDCVADKNWLSCLDAAYRSRPDAVSVAARLENAYPDSLVARYQYVHHLYGINAAYIPDGLGGAVKGVCFRLPESDGPVRGSACQASFLRRVLVEAGGYDESLTLSEDIELMLRLEGLGYPRPHYTGAAAVKHFYRRELVKVLRQFYLYGRGGPAFRRLRAERSAGTSAAAGMLANSIYSALECWHAKRRLLDLPALVFVAVAAHGCEYLGEARERLGGVLGGRKRSPVSGGIHRAPDSRLMSRAR